RPVAAGRVPGSSETVGYPVGRPGCPAATGPAPPAVRSDVAVAAAGGVAGAVAGGAPPPCRPGRPWATASGPAASGGTGGRPRHRLGALPSRFRAGPGAADTEAAGGR